MSTPRNERVFELTTLIVIGTDCTSSCKSNYHMITTTTTPIIMRERFAFISVLVTRIYLAYVLYAI